MVMEYSGFLYTCSWIYYGRVAYRILKHYARSIQNIDNLLLFNVWEACQSQEKSALGLNNESLSPNGILQHFINWIASLFQTSWCFGILVILNMEQAFSLYWAASCIIEE